MKKYFKSLKHNLTIVSKIADILWALGIECIRNEIRHRGFIIGIILAPIMMISSIGVIVILIIATFIAYPIVCIYLTIRELIGRPFTYNDKIYWSKQEECCNNNIDDWLNKYYK